MFMRIQVRYPKQIKVVHLTSKEARMTGFKGSTVRWKPVNRTVQIPVRVANNGPKDGEFDDI